MNTVTYEYNMVEPFHIYLTTILWPLIFFSSKLQNLFKLSRSEIGRTICRTCVKRKERLFRCGRATFVEVKSSLVGKESYEEDSSQQYSDLTYTELVNMN